MTVRRIAAVVLVGCALCACSHNKGSQVLEPVRDNVGAQGQRSETPLLVITSHDDFFGQSQRYLGNEVIITSPVTRVIGDHALTVKHGGFMGVAAKDILVLNDSGKPWTQLAKGTVLSVRGEARNFDLTQVEQEVGIQLDPETFSRFQGEPFILANAVEEHP